ncbi:MAG: adenylate kinase [Phycisphaerae bacterium]|nr:adenylate kinase [Phycisphaerae bacterium]
MNLVLLGPPGAGKGTQAARLCGAFSLVHLSSGDILRAERKAETELGRRAQDYMDRGVLVPDDLILAMMMDHLLRPEAASGFLLDGFPRTVVQAKGLDERLAERDRRIDVVVNIEVDDAEVARRLTGRWSCPQDGRIYHEVFSPPTEPRVCDDCGGALTRRKDDTPEVVGQRLRTYHEETEPLIAYYRDRDVLRSVNGSGEADEVFAWIKEVCQT